MGHRFFHMTANLIFKMLSKGVPSYLALFFQPNTIIRLERVKKGSLETPHFENSDNLRNSFYVLEAFT